MSELVLDLTQRYTYADYLTWLDDKRRELVNGFIMLMSPAPVRVHQDISGVINYNLYNHIRKRKGKCKVYQAPFDVRFVSHSDVSDEEITTVLQPDICIVCDLSKLDDAGCLGSPDFIAEILSPSTALRDNTIKKDVYEKYGVNEYWIINPIHKSVEVNILQEDGKYAPPMVFVKVGDVPVATLPGLSISLGEIFEE
ncbi:MAG: Uma2 family endonuclease [Ignavibacteria bacterium]|jgi:Uma2 family endonuclease|nr:Uma2 family endonuclease [Ignavibacteria bacterium]